MEKKRTQRSDDDYVLPGDSKNIWEETSKWRPVQLEILKAEFEDGSLSDITGSINLDDVELYPDAERILLSGVEVNDTMPAHELPREQVAFFNRLIQLTFYNDEPPVDTVAHDLLTYTGFESTCLHFRPRPHLEMSWRGYDISSEPDYGVYTRGHMKQRFAEFLVVVEDKPEVRRSYRHGECQLYGEMLLAAMNRYSLRAEDQTVFGVILRGPFVRFYRTLFSRQYLDELESDRIPHVKTIAKRYPEENRYPFSLNASSEREHVIKVLNAIRACTERLAEQA